MSDPDWTVLSAQHISDFVRREAARLKPGSCRQPVTAIRALLRFWSNGDIDPIMDKIKSWDDARTRWPNLMRKRGWLKPVLKWLSVIMVAVFLGASCNAGTNSFKALALTDLSYHQGNQWTLALDVFDHQGN